MKTITDFENENYFTPKTANRIAGEVGVEIPAAVKAEIEEMESTKPDFKVWELSERTDEDCDKLYAAIAEKCPIMMGELHEMNYDWVRVNLDNELTRKVGYRSSCSLYSAFFDYDFLNNYPPVKPKKQLKVIEKNTYNYFCTNGWRDGRNAVYYSIYEDAPLTETVSSENMPLVGPIIFGKIGSRFTVKRSMYDMKTGKHYDAVCYVFKNKKDALKAYSYWTNKSDLYHLV